MSEVFDIIGEFSDMCGAHDLYRLILSVSSVICVVYMICTGSD